jgi:hypothetical protein
MLHCITLKYAFNVATTAHLFLNNLNVFQQFQYISTSNIASKTLFQHKLNNFYVMMAAHLDISVF